MTPQERRNPKVLDNSRRHRVAKGAGVEAQDVNALVKQYDQMAPIMKAMSGKGMMERMSALKELQNSGMFDPGAKTQKIKQSTGKRLSSKEKAKMKKQREKEMRKKKRAQKRR